MILHLNINFDSHLCSYKCSNARGLHSRFSQFSVSEQVNILLSEYLKFQVIWAFPTFSHKPALCIGKLEQIGIKLEFFEDSKGNGLLVFLMTNDKMCRVSFSCS